jgi:hypothetical protein
MVAPQFMVARGGEYLLVHAADPGDAPSPSPVFERIVSSKRYGDLTLVAKSLPATADLIGGPRGEQLRDQAGRPIQLIEGLVLRGRHPGAASIWADQLTSVDAIAHETFPEFWRSEDETAAPVPSSPLTVTPPGVTAQICVGVAPVRDVMIVAILLIAGMAAHWALRHARRHEAGHAKED